MEYAPRRHEQFKGKEVEELASETHLLPIWHNEIQLKLAARAFPGVSRPIIPWLEEDETGHSLAERFRAYVESPGHREETVDLTDEARYAQILEEVKRQTLH